MATNSKGHSNSPRNHSPRHNTYAMSRALTIVSWVVCAVGVFLIIFNLQPFNDNNMGLMGGIGCLVAATFIYFIGKSFGSMQARSDEGKDGIKED
ncbi:hypothetical protein [Paenibacillus bovis]|nr:hypothetical protein [Paenibacillus bovis]